MNLRSHSRLHFFCGGPARTGLSIGQQEARLEQEALEEIRRRAKEEEEGEKRRLEEELARHKVVVPPACVEMFFFAHATSPANVIDHCLPTFDMSWSPACGRSS